MSQTYKRFLFFYGLIFILGIIVLFFLSDRRAQEVRRVDDLTGLSLPKSTLVLEKKFREVSFLGDGEDVILLQIDKEEKENIEKQIETLGWGPLSHKEEEFLHYSSEIDLHDFSIIRAKEKGKLFFTKTEGSYGDVDLVCYDEKTGKLLFISYNS